MFFQCSELNSSVLAVGCTDELWSSSVLYFYVKKACAVGKAMQHSGLEHEARPLDGTHSF